MHPGDNVQRCLRRELDLVAGLAGRRLVAGLVGLRILNANASRPKVMDDGSFRCPKVGAELCNQLPWSFGVSLGLAIL